MVVKAHDEEDDTLLPIFRLPPRDAPESLPKPRLIGGQGSTIGNELELIKRAMDAAENKARTDMEARLYSSNWDGDVYIGSVWNVGSVLAVITLAVPLLGLLVAYLGYGTLWTGSYEPPSMYL